MPDQLIEYILNPSNIAAPGPQKVLLRGHEAQRKLLTSSHGRSPRSTHWVKDSAEGSHS